MLSATDGPTMSKNYCFRLRKPSYINHYTCPNDDTQWSEDDCDSFHNDHCPVCGGEIIPTHSTDEDTGEEIRHDL
jgi:hypothetical protein